MQRAFILAKAASQLFGIDSNLDELNQLLAQGWKVVQSHPMQPSADSSRTLYTLVILESEGAQVPEGPPAARHQS
ncbi:MAG: hypothetical protein AB1505_12470 [Candidatus Latescibacterota bacterium]